MSSRSEARAKLERAVAISYWLLTRRVATRILYYDWAREGPGAGLLSPRRRRHAIWSDWQGWRAFQTSPKQRCLCASAGRRTALQRAFNLRLYAHSICPGVSSESRAARVCSVSRAGTIERVVRGENRHRSGSVQAYGL